MMKDGVLTHNHPSGGTFSSQDIDLLVYSDLREIRATSGKRTYRLERLKGDQYNRAQFSQDYASISQSYVKSLEEQYKKIMNDHINRTISFTEYQKRIDSLEASLIRMCSNWLKANARKYGYRYGVSNEKH